jgi:hypothetical protein
LVYIEGNKTARSLTTDESIIAPNRLLTQAMVTQLRDLLAAIARFNEEIAQCARWMAHRDVRHENEH